MSKFELIPYTGAGGGKGGSKPKIDKDTLFSRDHLEAVVAFGEGVYYGLVDGLNSVSFNGEYLSYKEKIDVKDLYLSMRLGYEDDAPIEYFLGGENFVISSAQKELLFDRPETYHTPRELRGKVRFIQLRLIVQGLFFGNSKGDLRTNAVAFQIRYKRASAPSSSWVYVSQSTNSTTHKSLILDAAKTQAREEGKIWEFLSSAEKNEIIEECEKVIVSQDYATTTGSIIVSKRFGVTDPNLRFIVITKITNKKHVILDSYDSSKFNDDDLYFISGKTSSGYVHELTLPVPTIDDDDWVVEIVKATKEYPPDEAYSRRTVGISEVSAILAKYRHYPRTVLAHIVAPYDTQFQAVGDVAAEFYCLLIDVPTNYNGFLHRYDESSPWLGDYKKAWSNNNVWVLREVIMNPDWGLRRYEPNIMVDNASFYKWAKYCDEQLVTIEGEKSLGFRHTFNDVISNPRNLESFIGYVCSSFRGSLEERNGVYYLTVDTHREPRFFVTPETISDVGFTYSKTELGTRWNQVKVSFQNQELDYEDDVRIISDKASIQKYGLITGEIQPVGCTDLSQAIRHGAYALFTNSQETTLVSFQIPRLGLYLEKFDNFYICDPDLNWGHHSRIVSLDSDRITLLHPSKLPPDSKVTILSHSATGIISTGATLQNSTTLVLDSNVASYPTLYKNDPICYFLSSSIDRPRIFRVLNVSDEGTGDGLMYTVEASSVAMDKYIKVDHLDSDSQELTFSSESFETIFGRIAPPENLRVQILDYATKNGAPVYRVMFDESEGATFYEASWYLSEGDGDVFTQEIFGSRAEVSPAFPDNGIPINFSLVAVAADGKRSRPVHLLRYTPTVSQGDLEVRVSVSSWGFYPLNSGYSFFAVFHDFDLNPLGSRFSGLRSTLTLSSNPNHGYQSRGFTVGESARGKAATVVDFDVNYQDIILPRDEVQTVSLALELSLKDNPSVFEFVKDKFEGSYGRNKPTKMAKPSRRLVTRMDTYTDSFGREHPVPVGFVGLKVRLEMPDLSSNPLLSSVSDFFLHVTGVTSLDPYYSKKFDLNIVRLSASMVEFSLQGYVVENAPLIIKHKSYPDYLVPFESEELIINY